MTFSLDTRVALRNDSYIDDAVEHFNNCIQKSAWEASPETVYIKSSQCSPTIREKLAEKRKAKEIWQKTRFYRDKSKLNRITAELKRLLNNDKNIGIQTYLENLDVTAATDYSLWKATKKLKRPIIHHPPIRKPDNTWASNDVEKAVTFAEHLDGVFIPNPDEGSRKVREVLTFLEQTHNLDPPIKKFSKHEIHNAIKKLPQHKAPGYDLITATVLKQLPEKGIVFLTQLCNSILWRIYVPSQWKVAQIIMIL